MVALLPLPDLSLKQWQRVVQSCAGKGGFPGAIRPKKKYVKSCETCFTKNTLSFLIRVQAWNEFVSQSFIKFYSPLASWPWLRISPQSSLYVIYCLIPTAWRWLMSFTCIPVQIEPSKSSLRKRLLALLLWEIGHISSPSRSCLDRLILIHGRPGVLRAEHLHSIC